LKTFKVTVDNQTYTVKVEEISGHSNQQSEANVKNTASQAAAKSPSSVSPQKTPTAEPKQEEAVKPAPSTGEGYVLKAPMPGSVLEVQVKEGDSVNDGDVLLVLEAMKMENELTASQPGTVSKILVKKGDAVNSGDPLIELS